MFLLVDNSYMIIKDPECTPLFCNGRGRCILVDIYLSCLCEIGYLGDNCQIEKSNYLTLKSYFSSMYDKLLRMTKSTSVSQSQVKSMWYVLTGLSLFFQESNYPDMVYSYINSVIYIF